MKIKKTVAYLIIIIIFFIFIMTFVSMSWEDFLEYLLVICICLPLSFAAIWAFHVISNNDK